MNRLTFCFILAFAAQANYTLAQQTIVYGSNKGKYISIHNTKVYYEEYGKGTPLLMIHGGTVSISSFRKVIPDLARHFTVMAVDTPGHGRSQQADSMSYPFMADYFSRIVDALRLDSAYVIGWSDGGEIALLLSAQRPDKIKRVIVAGAQLGHSGYTESGRKFTNTFSPEVVQRDWGPWVKNYQENAYKGNDWRDFISDVKKMWDTPVYIPDDKVKLIRARCLIILGDRDLITIAHGNEMYNAIKGSEFLVLPNTSHMVFEEQPEVFSKIGIEFLTRK